MQNGWIKIEGPLLESHFPCWLAAEGTGQVMCWQSIHNMKRCEPMWELYTHRKPMPPQEAPRSPQATQDESDFIARYGRPHNTEGFQRMGGWLNGVRDERSFLRSMFDHYLATNMSRDDFIKRFCARVES